jgi:hypothetical protein
MNVFKIEFVMVNDKFKYGPGRVFSKVRENGGLGFVEAHFQEPTKYISPQQHFYKINKGRLVVVFERVNDHTVIFGDDDVVKRIE